MRKVITFLAILLGFTAISSQIIFLREIIIVFQGNELSLALVFAIWLMGGATGSILFGKLVDRFQTRLEMYSVCQLLVGILLVITLAIIRSLRFGLNAVAGGNIPVFPMMLSSLATFLPITMLFGAIFVVLCRLSDDIATYSDATGRVYSSESIGSVFGGIVTSLFFVKWFTSSEILGILGVINIFAAYIVQFKIHKRLNFFVFVVSGLVFLGVTFTLVGGWKEMDTRSVKRQWRGFDVVASKNSIYGNIVITKNGDQFSFFENGLHAFTIPDPSSSEEAVHFPLLQHQAPKDLLIIGGGLGGLVEEALKYPLRKVDYVELDPLIIKMAYEYLPARYLLSLKDPRVHIKNVDGRFFVKTTSAKYDVIITHLGDPSTAQLNRYYTVEYFQELKRMLNKGGIVSFVASSSESYLNKEQAGYLGSLYDTLKQVFKNVLVLPGPKAHFIVSDDDVATYDYRILDLRAQERGVNTRYVRSYYLMSSLSPEKILYMQRSIANARFARTNRDLEPISYYRNIVLWLSQCRDSVLTKFFYSINENMIWTILFIKLILIIGVCVAALKKGILAYRHAALLGLAIGGFSGMTIQFLVILAFQVMYGYLFYAIGFMVAAYMAGLAMGSNFVSRKLVARCDDIGVRRIFTVTCFCFGLFSLVLSMIFIVIFGVGNGVMRIPGAAIIFLVLSFTVGFIAGVQFPAANRILLEGNRSVGKAAGVSYGLDLLGAAIGVFVVGVFLLPIMGMYKTITIVALCNFVVVLLLILTNRKEGQI